MRLIAGVDPGKTVGIACLDLSGRLVFSAHESGLGIDWIVQTIRSVGIPVIIASDRKNPSALVRKVNASFNARLFSPERELSMDAKTELGRNASIRNPHERDAFVAAVCAYKHYANKFNQVEHLARERNVDDIDLIKARIVGKYSIDEAISNRKQGRK